MEARKFPPSPFYTFNKVSVNMVDARNNSDDLDERIRRCIREELTINNTGVDRNSNQTLVAIRARD